MTTPETIPDSEELLDCDLVMKGGITSGVVYPKAVVRIAQRYRVRSVGGTSVGAIAAAMTAAAEYFRQSDDPNGTKAKEMRRQHRAVANVIQAMDSNEWDSANEAIKNAEDDLISSKSGFAGLYSIPNELGNNLLGKFQPEPSTRGLFNYAIGILQSKNMAGRLIAAVLKGFYIFRLLSAALFFLLTLALLWKPEIAAWLAAPIFVFGLTLFIFSSRPVKKSISSPRIGPSKLGKVAVVVSIALAAYLYSLIGWGLGLVSQPTELDDLDWPLVGVLELSDHIRSNWDTWSELSIPDVWRLIGEHLGTLGALGNGMIIGWITGAAAGLGFHLMWSVPRNMNGMCSGLGDEQSLTNWLTAKIDAVAGLTPDPTHPKHLTFGQLETYHIHLEAITSELTRGVPLDLPKALGNYGFRPSELSKFFPKSVMRQLCPLDISETSDDIVEFPKDGANIPIVVVARMSLSFPVLFSSIPVYWKNMDGSPSWLSDGGVVSNFPLHKFDRALPPWPTFAMDLINKDEGRPDRMSMEQIATAPINTDSQRQTRDPAQRVPDLKMNDLIGLFSGILNTSRGWIDNSQKTLPGYAERIVGINLYAGEGGLNLDMKNDTIAHLADRGMFGANWLVEKWEPFQKGDDSGSVTEWDQHRWIRYRIIMRELEELGREWTWVYGAQGTENSPPGRWRNAHRKSIETLVAEATAGNGLPAGFLYSWFSHADARDAAKLSGKFREFAVGPEEPQDAESVDADPSERQVIVGDEIPASANLDAVVFSKEKTPKLNPKWLMLPPFH